LDLSEIVPSKRFSSFSDLIDAEPNNDAMKLALSPGIDHCTPTSLYMNCTFDLSGPDFSIGRLCDLLFSADVDLTDVGFDGLRACGTIHEMARVVNLTIDRTAWSNWQILILDVESKYGQAFKDASITFFRWDELFAIWMPLFLPPFVMLFRALRPKPAFPIV
jgi:hypothetical protein